MKALTPAQPTLLAMINAAAADNYHGPFELDIATTQYNECLAHYTDGSGQMALDRILQLPQISAVNPSDQLAAGSLVLRGISRETVEWAQINLTGEPALSIVVMEWASGDGMAHNFKVMAIGAPRVKADYNGNSAVVHYTGA